PLAALRWDGVAEPDEAAEAAAAECFAEAARMWAAERDAIDALLRGAQPVLNQRSHKPDAVADALAAWTVHFEQGDATAALPKAALKLTQTALTKATKKGGTTPAHAFFDVADA
ncbi:hypothetical protein QM312_35935, partial [Burkholderia cenocepacia]|uniref:hypothetical protein n=1 Tax=Burkholderia cenocepacia TaxID=95486 RepID=UPI0024B83859